MKNLFIVSFLLFSATLFAQRPYFQQKVDHEIDVALYDKDKTLAGFQTIRYQNNSPDTLNFIWFHIWPNAYKNRQTALFKQIDGDDSRKSKETDAEYGWISGLDFKVNGKAAKTSPHANPVYIDIIKLNLPAPLIPGGTATITTPFKVKLPSYFSRSGHADGQFMVTQWYPKPAVYDNDGWHEMPYLDMGEYYNEYGDYTVNITIPGDYITGATGVLQTKNELEKYKKLGKANTSNREGEPQLYSPASLKNKVLKYTAQNVPDFAWFAGKNMVIQYDTIQLKSGTVDALSFYHNKPNTIWNKSIDYVKDATRKYSEWIGDYEYPTVQAFEGPKNNASGGMEYPMITLITQPDANPEALDGVITHEIGHNWFMSMLGSNERMHTWQDEGLNTYYQLRYEAEKYRSVSFFGDMLPPELKRLPVHMFQQQIYSAVSQIPMEGAIDIPAADFKNSEDYGLISYIKAALWVYQLEAKFGRARLDDAFQAYFKEWKNRHPKPEDMKAAFEKSLGTNLDAFFGLLKKEGRL